MGLPQCVIFANAIRNTDARWLISIMAVKYSLAKMNTKLNGKSYEKVYAHAQVNETTSLKKFSQLIASLTTVSRVDVSAVPSVAWRTW